MALPHERERSLHYVGQYTQGNSCENLPFQNQCSVVKSGHHQKDEPAMCWNTGPVLITPDIGGICYDYSYFIPHVPRGQTAMNPYQGSSYRITKEQWDELNKLFMRIEPPAQNELYASGDHYILAMTLRRMGFNISSDAMEIYRMAEQILAEGWDE